MLFLVSFWWDDSHITACSNIVNVGNLSTYAEAKRIIDTYYRAYTIIGIRAITDDEAQSQVNRGMPFITL